MPNAKAKVPVVPQPDDRPIILASWLDYPPALLTDHEYVGAKAAGLFRLPREWVPPFLVLTRAFYASHKLNNGRTHGLGSLSHQDNQLLTYYLQKIRDRAWATTPRLLVRSNAPTETLRVRGSYASLTASPNIADIAEAITKVFASSGTDAMCIILQACITPGWLGHMSNERRVTASKRRWLVEDLIHFRRESGQRFILASTPAASRPLDVHDSKQLIRTLRRIAAAQCSQSGGCFHIEWVWSGHRLWIVQADEEHAPNVGNELPNFLKRRAPQIPQFIARSCLRHYRSVVSGRWRKLEKPKLFDQLGLPTADVTVLTGEEWTKGALASDRTFLCDLGSLCSRRLVVRCDVASDIQIEDTLLPTSAATGDLSHILTFMTNASAWFAERGIAGKDWAFLLANLIDVKASAMVHAQPGTERVRVDALWGFADGLLYFPHDTWYYYPKG